MAIESDDMHELADSLFARLQRRLLHACAAVVERERVTARSHWWLDDVRQALLRERSAALRRLAHARALRLELQAEVGLERARQGVRELLRLVVESTLPLREEGRAVAPRSVTLRLERRGPRHGRRAAGVS